MIAFEAQERIFYALAGNIALNNCFNARAIWAAVGAASGEIGVPVPNYLHPSSYGSLEIRKTERTQYIGQDIDYGKAQPTKLLAIDDLRLKRLDFLKIDIEGMEMEALKGAEKTILRTRPQMMIEKIKSDEKGISRFLSAMGYRMFPLGINILAIHESDRISTRIKVETSPLE